MDVESGKHGLHIELVTVPPSREPVSVGLVDHGAPHHVTAPKVLALLDAETADRLRVQLERLDWRSAP